MGRNETLICAPLMADTVDQLVELMHKAKIKGADIVEIRLDHLKSFDPHFDVERLIKECPLPTLFTYRPTWEGGQYDGDEKSRFGALRTAMELGADHIDIELKAANEFNKFMNGNKPGKCKVIVSSHNYDCTPSAEDLGNLVSRIQAAGADIVKFATTALDITDVARVFQVTVHSQVPIIAMAMGERGLMSRVLCPKFGGYLTFGTLEPGEVSAPGQPTIEDLVSLYNFRSIGPDTKVFGIIGKPVAHSKSPLLYNGAFKSENFNGVFVYMLVDDVPKFFETYSTSDFTGFSCTIPHKEVALACCDEVDPVAKSIGAVNCLIRRPNGKLFGCNTDYIGAINAIENGLRGSHNISNGSPLAGKLFIVIGAGGAGKSIAYGAKEKGARVVIANRTYDRARELAEVVGGQALSLAELDSFHPESGMILANTSSIGMQPKVDETPVTKEALRYYDLVFDVVYTPKITRLLREAEEMGAKIVSGVDMFVGQAYEQYERFTGLPGAHTIGVAHCGAFSRRLFNFTGKGDTDPSLDPPYAAFLKTRCPNPENLATGVGMDPNSSLSFDSHYFTAVNQNTAFFQSDAALLTNPTSAGNVRRFQFTRNFFEQFVASMMKMWGTQVLIGDNAGEIWKNCRIVNPKVN